METLDYPPFSIQKRTVIDRQFKPNEGTVSKLTYTKYKIFYQDQLLSFPPELDANTGVSGIWKAYHLQNAPTPTILVASNNVYLVTAENDSVKMTLVEKKHSNYASIQWLDANDGQPGPKTEILIGEDTTNCNLHGGQFLLVNENTVLRVADLHLFPFNKSPDLTDDYYPNNVLAFSPDKNEIVFLGSKSHEINRTQFIHALLVYNYTENQVYTIPVDRTETRIHDPYRLSANWVYTYFEWQQDETGKYTLTPKQLSQLPNWEGYYARPLRYQLAPVQEEMHLVFLDFVRDILQLEEAAIRSDAYGGLKEYTITHEGFIINIGYLEELASVSLSLSFMNKGPEEEAKVVIKKVGDAFNEVLKAGEHQTLFTHY